MRAIDLYAHRAPGYDERVARTLAVLQSAAAEHSGAVVQATSLGAEDMVVTDLIARHQLPIAIATLDTGALHAETVALIESIELRYGLAVEVFRPQSEAVLHFVREQGDAAMYRSIALRKRCCGLRKLEPLSRMLATRRAWITGLRREQSHARQEVPLRERDDGGRVKINPLADWLWSDVWQYIADHAVPYNPLHDAFMPSIGCAPCTRAIAVGENFRAGRWWWEDDGAKECGLHVKAAPIAAPVRRRPETESIGAQA
ncbi:MAG TPA: phosphoadenylyl-sulfate reductase [Burkholderiaceae bacterium]|nr:phosphoadenylyl-sulfate reductase [Burkholderiaceae bacterium]